MADRWLVHKDTIKELYLIQGKTVNEVVKQMASKYDFRYRYVPIFWQRVWLGLTPSPCLVRHSMSVSLRNGTLGRIQRPPTGKSSVGS